MSERVKVLVIGQTPPPYHGQAIMIDRLLRGRFTRVQLYHVRMAFSDSVGEVGRFRISKLFHLVAVIARIIYCRAIHRPAVLCYPPAGPNRVPLFRDIAILLCTRWMFRRTILYFHAGGVSQLYPQLSLPMQWLFRRALFAADAAIRVSRGSPDDGRALQARRNYVIPNGIEDESIRFTRRSIGAAFCSASAPASLARHASIENDSPGNRSATALLDQSNNTLPLQILFLSILTESKGLLDLIDACHILANRGIPFDLHVGGQFASAKFAAKIQERVCQFNLNARVRLLGSLTGDAKWRAFASADVFCFPTYYEAETFGVVLVEAMSFSLPIIATRWRGVPEIVDDGVTGFLVNLHDPAAIADRLEQLYTDTDLQTALGSAGREKFQREFTVDRYWQHVESVFLETAAVT